MKFFMPYARGEAAGEAVWGQIRRFLAGQGYPTTGRRLRRIAFHNRADHFDLEVGGHHPGMEDEWPVDGREENPAIRCTVMAIYEGRCGLWYYVCLPYRGVLRNYPWLVHVDEVTAVELFEPWPPETLCVAPARCYRQCSRIISCSSALNRRSSSGDAFSS